MNEAKPFVIDKRLVWEAYHKVKENKGSAGIDKVAQKTFQRFRSSVMLMIVYCKDSNRRGDSEHTSFDFLGFTFRPRGARNRKTGQNFTAFLPAISKKSMKRIKEAVRAWNLNRKTFACLLDISNEVDTQISGWMNYYMKFGRSEFRKVLNYINERLTRWVMRKYKRFSKGKKFSKAYEWLVEYAAHNRNEFSHWVKGFVPYPRLG